MKKIIFYLVVIFALTLKAVPVDGQVLNVRETIQEHSMWCWDASSVCIMDYYGFVFTQCEIANWAFSRSDCCGEPVFHWIEPDGTIDPPRHPCNSGNYLAGYSTHDIDDILIEYASLGSSIMEKALTTAELQTEMGGKRPFVMRFDWKNGGAHALVGHGIAGDDVYYMDPWPGNGFTIQDYDFVVESDGHWWTRTLTLDTSPVGVDFYLLNAEVTQSCSSPGGSVTVSCEILYAGSELAANVGNVNLGYYLRKSGSTDPSTYVFLDWVSSSLGTDNRSSTINATLGIPPNTLAGYYDILFVADYDNLFAETNEDNNSIGMTLWIDTTVPILSCPADADRSADPGVCTFIISGTGLDATATDNGTVETLSWVLTGATTGSGNNSLDGTSLNLGENFVTWTATDECGNSSTCQRKITIVDSEDPVITCKPYAVRSSDAGKCTYTAAGTEFDAIATDNCDVQSMTWILSGATAGSGNTSLDGVEFNFGVTAVTWTAEDYSGNKSTCSMEVDMNRITTLTEVAVSPDEQQYSDPVIFTATIQGGVCTGLGDAATHVTFFVGDQPMGDPVPLLPGGGLLTASATYALLEYPGYEGSMDPDPTENPKLVTAYFSGINEDFEVNNATTNLTVIPENACAIYAGVYYASTGSANSNEATVVLAATIVEEDDGYPGDFFNSAFVQFLADGREIATVPVTPVSEVNGELPIGEIGASYNIGAASYEWNGVPIGVYDIRVRLIGYYTNHSAGDCDGEAIVTVGTPSSDFISGGGYVVLENPMGLAAGDVGSKNNFGFNVKYNKNLTNLKGNISTIIRRTEADGLHIYRAKGNVMTSLTIYDNKAVFTGKCSLQDITNPDDPVDVTDGGGATLQFTMTDNGEPGLEDLISITIWKRDGGLWFTTLWDNDTYLPAEQSLDGGNLVVKSAKDDEGGQKPPKKKSAEIAIAEDYPLKVFPNPFSDRFYFEFIAPSDVTSRLEIFDSTGRKIKILFEEKVTAGQLYRIEYLPEHHVTQMLIYRMTMGDHSFHGKVLYKK